MRASIVPLIAGGIAGLVIIAVPVMLTELLALRSNRPEFSFIEAGRGSLHWTHLLSLIFPDLFGAMDRQGRFLGRGRLCLERALRHGRPLPRAEHGAALCGRARAGRARRSALARGWLWSREIRFFTIAAVLIAFFMFGWYTPVFRVMYEVMPGVKLFRRPADGDLRVRRADRGHGGLSGAPLARPDPPASRDVSARIAIGLRAVILVAHGLACVDDGRRGVAREA